MPHLAHVTVAADEAPAVLDALLSVYGARADALAEAAGRTDQVQLAQARAALLDADAALETFGTHRGPRIRDAELTGSPRLVTDVLVAALSDAAERFDDALESYGRGETSLAELQRSEERLAALLALFAAHEGEHAV